MRVKRENMLTKLLIICFATFLGAFLLLNSSNSVYAEQNTVIFQGEGSKDSPYLISNEIELFAFADSVNSGNSYAGKVIKLTSDIDLANKEWTPIGTSSAPFCGTFDGDNHIIKNLKISCSKEYVSGGTNQNYVGLFGYMMGGSSAGIKNLTIENADVTGCLYVGVILGRSYTGGIIENCHVKGHIKVDAYAYAGIVVGRHEYSSGKNSNGEIMSMYNCSVDGTNDKATINCDYAVSYVGGIVGFLAEGGYVFSDLSVKNVEITGTYGVGGISGIGHYGNSFFSVSVSSVDVISVNNDPTSNRTGNVGLIVGACQGTETQQTVFKEYSTSEASALVNGEPKEEIFGNNMNGSSAITNFVAKANGKYFESLSEAVSQLGDDDKIVLLKNSDENIVFPAGVKIEQNEFSAPSVALTPLEIESITTSRNSENNATIITITYLNSEKVTTFEIPDGKNGINGINGIDGVDGLNGKDGKDGKDGVDGQNGKDGKDGLNGANGKDGQNGKDGKDGANGQNGRDASSTLVITSFVVAGISLSINIVIVIFLLKKKR